MIFFVCFVYLLCRCYIFSLILCRNKTLNFNLFLFFSTRQAFNSENQTLAEVWVRRCPSWSSTRRFVWRQSPESPDPESAKVWFSETSVSLSRQSPIRKVSQNLNQRWDTNKYNVFGFLNVTFSTYFKDHIIDLL